MSRKLTALKRELGQLKRATGVDDKGTEDNFHELAIACNVEPDDRSKEQIYKSYSFDELKFAFGKNTNNWPLWARQKFGV
jgi:hypothetical protein